ncbi:hypothetical protein H9Y04_43735 [Streptomyces sp. TRM66268-LWL]|uniref:Thioredoxin domain-containing protein n=1 Tax=Streptomyces polyasparticus TaxID=2767826 RepID=A0ABR7SXP9_9ACTN|nr:hypothetical protein [Streptomyces polyasparticus]MBC9719440.1 hypothetical protein [Streptomyces polyasparticus]
MRAVCLLAAVSLFGSGCSGGEEQPERRSQLAVGAKAPEVQADDVLGAAVESDGRGPVLVAFLRPTTGATSAQQAAARSSAVVAQSMATQYAARGLRVVIVDAAGTEADRDELVNLAYDWHLDGVQLLGPEAGGKTAASFGVSATPVTYLIGPDGIVDQRWAGTLSAQAVGPAVQHAVK